jgi:hypothetical protein
MIRPKRVVAGPTKDKFGAVFGLNLNNYSTVTRDNGKCKEYNS